MNKQDIILNYYISKGQDPKKTIEYIRLLMRNSQMMNIEFSGIIEETKKDYHVNILRDLRKNPILVLKVF